MSKVVTSTFFYKPDKRGQQKYAD
ncbi:hypothetical protein OOU_Y34scaffold00085g1 [Pyricularia oryzae Y34]|uniref:Uncharacterized protein n=2 Tax=Pyricularia oryzae TaxID=318829 RepID=A0AA97P9K2_PYRO3|nr:hypothetical protein OOU_Y34scaffold00085g1 [Pyricularia oryzae Y34]